VPQRHHLVRIGARRVKFAPIPTPTKGAPWQRCASRDHRRPLWHPDLYGEEAYRLSGTILIYGATGYTGKLIAKVATGLGARPILAGRDLEKVQAIAKPLGLAFRAFDLGDPGRIDAGIKDVSVVLCVAGPFSTTSKPMADACLRNRVHYLDITGEIDVFEALAARGAEARARGVMLLPGVGFDVVPSDCLAAHLKRRQPDATHLKLYLSLGANMSRGTAKTMIEAVAAGTRLRRDRRLVTRTQAEEGSCDFGKGERPTVQVSWGDVSTAYHSTGIPNIEVHFEALRAIRRMTQTPAFIKSFLGLGFMQSFLKAQIDRMPEGPSEQHAERDMRCWWAKPATLKDKPSAHA
jgi:short subunit dehydrogenase-like uncharacterized protein